MIMVHCIYQGNLDPKEYFSMPVKSVIHKIQEFFSEPSNHSRLSSVNLKNLEELDKLKLVFK